MRFQAKKNGQKLELIDNSWPFVLSNLKDGIKYEIIIKRFSKHRTNKQNSTYHMLRAWWVDMMLEDGNIYSPIESEYWFKEWIGWMQESEFIDKDGEVHTKVIPKSTHNLTTIEMSALYKMIVDRAHDWWPGCIVPKVEF